MESELPFLPETDQHAVLSYVVRRLPQIRPLTSGLAQVKGRWRRPTRRLGGERHVLQRFAPQLFRIGYPIGGQSDECLAKRDFQFLGLVPIPGSVCIEGRPYGVERLLKSGKD